MRLFRPGYSAHLAGEWLPGLDGVVAKLRGRDGEGLPGQGYDRVCLFDALRDMGDLAGAARRIRQALAPDGTLLLAEPNAGDAWRPPAMRHQIQRRPRSEHSTHQSSATRTVHQ